MSERPKPGNLSGGSGRRIEVSENRALRPRSSTGTKSMAYAVARRRVPWLGTRSAGLFCTNHRPRNGYAKSRVRGTNGSSRSLTIKPDPAIARIESMKAFRSPARAVNVARSATTAHASRRRHRSGLSSGARTGVAMAEMIPEKPVRQEEITIDEHTTEADAPSSLAARDVTTKLREGDPPADARKYPDLFEAATANPATFRCRRQRPPRHRPQRRHRRDPARPRHRPTTRLPTHRPTTRPHKEVGRTCRLQVRPIPMS
ncbi:MAG: hypothetical protein QOI54_147 [Actinomycetota bacterium]|nr:hypothetical protein [Actinomycetota bacterium]